MKSGYIFIIIIFIFSKSIFSQETQMSGKQLTLDDCIKLAIENNLALKQKKMAVQKNEIQGKITKTQKQPQISFYSDYTHTTANNRLFPAEYPNAPGLYTNDILTSRITAKMPLYDFGKINNEIESADLLVEQSEYLTQLSEKELKFNVINLFYSILKQNKLIESIESSIKTLLEQKKRITELISANKKTKIDLMKIDYRISEIEQELTSAIAKRNILYFNLNLLFNNSFENIFIKDCEICFDTNILKLSNEHFDEAYQNRSDLKAAELDLKIKKNNVEIAESKKKPLISLFSNIDNKSALKNDIIQTNADKTKNNWLTGIIFEVPLWTGDRINQQIKQAETESEISKTEIEKIKGKINFEIRSALKLIETYNTRIQSALKNISLSEETLNIEKEKYELGKSSITDVLLEETNYLKAKTVYFSAVYDYAVAVENLKFYKGF